VRQLASQVVCACDLTACCDVSQPTVSHHLKVLREAGVIEGERRGTWIYYRLLPEAAARLERLASMMRPPPGPLSGGAGRDLPVIQPAT
jgi:DNA-binding transcriptional ArsR family regulator